MPKPPIDLPIEHYKKLVFYLKAFVPDSKVLAFGSRVNGTAQELSDIDLVLINPNDPAQATGELSRLRSALQESDLPYLVDIHDWSELPEQFKHTIESKHVQLLPLAAKE